MTHRVARSGLTIESSRADSNGGHHLSTAVDGWDAAAFSMLAGRRLRPSFVLVGFSALACATVASESMWPAHERVAISGVTGSDVDRQSAASDVQLSPEVDADAETDEPVCIDSLSDDELKMLLEIAPETLDSISLGPPNHGALINGVQLRDGPYWSVTESEQTWGTRETLADLTAAIETVATQFPDSPKLFIGEISARHGGYLSPHRSHQSGRDVDIGYYYLDGPRWYMRADASNLDRDRTWALVKALAPTVEYIFMDRSIQALLREHAASIGEDTAWLDDFFEGTKDHGNALVRHAWGHTTHLHARFKSARAERAGQRVEPLWANKQWYARLLAKAQETADAPSPNTHGRSKGHARAPRTPRRRHS